MLQRRLLYLCVFFGLAYLALATVAGVFMAEAALHPSRRSLAASDELRALEVARAHDARLADIAIGGRDGAILDAWSIRPQSGNGSVVILLHGVGDNRMGMIGYADLLLGHGFSVLMPDARAHGKSGGHLASYGLLESQDIRGWFEWLQQNQHPTCIFGFGESMGAAQLLQSLRIEPGFCAVAAESSFSTLREIAYDRVGQFFSTGPWLGHTLLRPVVEAAFGYVRWKYGLDFDQASPEKIVAATKVPVLLIHGRDDRNIPVGHSRRIAAENPSVNLWEVPGADHCGASNIEPKEFERRLVQWFDSHSSGTFTAMYLVDSSDLLAAQ